MYAIVDIAGQQFKVEKDMVKDVGDISNLPKENLQE